MPHIAMTMIPGRDDETKHELAQKMQDFLSEELKLDKQFISVSIEDIPKDQWEDSMKKFSEDIMFVKPGN